MARFHGKIGYGTPVEKAPSVYVIEITERSYTGDEIKNYSKTEPGEGLNDNIIINNQISVVADPYAYENFQKIKYIEWMGSKWKVTSVEVQRPRLILSIGGVYNEQETSGA